MNRFAGTAVLCAGMMLGVLFSISYQCIGQQKSAAADLEEVLTHAQAAQAADRYEDAARLYAQATMVQPGIAELWANRGLMEHFAGHPEQALVSFKHALALKPSLFTPLLFTGVEYVALNKPELALPNLKRALHLQPSNPDVSVALGKAYAAMNDPRQAAKAFQDAVGLRPHDTEAWYGLGTSCLAVIDQDGGRLAENQAASAWSKALYADAMLVQGRKLEAVDAYKQAAALSSTSEREIFSAVLLQMREAAASQTSAAVVPPAFIDEVLAVVQPSSGQLVPTCRTPRAGAISDRDTSALTQKMVCGYLDKDMVTAATAAASQLAITPNNPEALYWSVKANEKRAVEALARYEQLAPQSPATYDMVGDLYRRRSQPDSALEQYSKALVINPHDAPALMGSAASYLSIGNMEKTLTTAETALVDSPKDARLNLIAAEALVSLRRFADARPYLLQCLASVKGHDENSGLTSLGPRAHALLGQVEADAGNIPEAIAEMNLGLSSDQDGSLYFQLSRLYRKEGKVAEAQQAIDHAKEHIAQRRSRAALALKSSTEQSH